MKMTKQHENDGLNQISQPELLEQPQYACLSAAWFWATKGLNTLADAGDFDTITQRINESGHKSRCQNLMRRLRHRSNPSSSQLSS